MERRDLSGLARGARLLGSGGGGDPTLWRLLADTALADRRVTVADPATLPDDALVIAAAMIGSPAITAELVPRGDEFVRAFQGLEHHLGKRAAAVIGFETAGVNVFPPIIVAATLGLPLLDLDGMGRAFPRVELTVLHARGFPVSPVASAGVSGEVVIIETERGERAEALARATLAPLGGWVGHACYPITVAQARAGAIAGSLARVAALGEAARRARDPESLAELAGGRLLGRGRVLTVERADAGGPRGSVFIDDFAAPGATLRIELQSEYLLATRDGAVLAATPDPILLVDPQTLETIGCEEVRAGLEVAALTLPSDPAWREPASLALAGPAAFGYPVAVTA